MALRSRASSNCDVGETAEQSLARIELPNTVSSSNSYHLHPALLDACVQICEASLPDYAEVYDSDLYLPMVWERITVHCALAGLAWCVASNQSKGRGPIRTFDLQLVDQSGRVLIKAEGLHFKRAGQADLLPAGETDRWSHKVVWQVAAEPPATQSNGPERWLIFADSDGLGERVSNGIGCQGA